MSTTPPSSPPIFASSSSSGSPPPIYRKSLAESNSNNSNASHSLSGNTLKIPGKKSSNPIPPNAKRAIEDDDDEDESDDSDDDDEDDDDELVLSNPKSKAAAAARPQTTKATPQLTKSLSLSSASPATPTANPSISASSAAIQGSRRSAAETSVSLSSSASASDIPASANTLTTIATPQDSLDTDARNDFNTEYLREDEQQQQQESESHDSVSDPSVTSASSSMELPSSLAALLCTPDSIFSPNLLPALEEFSRSNDVSHHQEESLLSSSSPLSSSLLHYLSDWYVGIGDVCNVLLSWIRAAAEEEYHKTHEKSQNNRNQIANSDETISALSASEVSAHLDDFLSSLISSHFCQQFNSSFSVESADRLFLHHYRRCLPPYVVSVLSSSSHLRDSICSLTKKHPDCLFLRESMNKIFSFWMNEKNIKKYHSKIMENAQVMEWKGMVEMVLNIIKKMVENIQKIWKKRRKRMEMKIEWNAQKRKEEEIEKFYGVEQEEIREAEEDRAVAKLIHELEQLSGQHEYAYLLVSVCLRKLEQLTQKREQNLKSGHEQNEKMENAVENERKLEDLQSECAGITLILRRVRQRIADRTAKDQSDFLHSKCTQLRFSCRTLDVWLDGGLDLPQLFASLTAVAAGSTKKISAEHLANLHTLYKNESSQPSLQFLCSPLLLDALMFVAFSSKDASPAAVDHAIDLLTQLSCASEEEEEKQQLLDLFGDFGEEDGRHRKDRRDALRKQLVVLCTAVRSRAFFERPVFTALQLRSYLSEPLFAFAVIHIASDFFNDSSATDSSKKLTQHTLPVFCRYLVEIIRSHCVFRSYILQLLIASLKNRNALSKHEQFPHLLVELVHCGLFRQVFHFLETEHRLFDRSTLLSFIHLLQQTIRTPVSSAFRNQLNIIIENAELDESLCWKTVEEKEEEIQVEKRLQEERRKRAEEDRKKKIREKESSQSSGSSAVDDEDEDEAEDDQEKDDKSAKKEKKKRARLVDEDEQEEDKEYQSRYLKKRKAKILSDLRKEREEEEKKLTQANASEPNSDTPAQPKEPNTEEAKDKEKGKEKEKDAQLIANDTATNGMNQKQESVAPKVEEEVSVSVPFMATETESVNLYESSWSDDEMESTDRTTASYASRVADDEDDADAQYDFQSPSAARKRKAAKAKLRLKMFSSEVKAEEEKEKEKEKEKEQEKDKENEEQKMKVEETEASKAGATTSGETVMQEQTSKNEANDKEKEKEQEDNLAPRKRKRKVIVDDDEHAEAAANDSSVDQETVSNEVNTESSAKKTKKKRLVQPAEEDKQILRIPAARSVAASSVSLSALTTATSKSLSSAAAANSASGTKIKIPMSIVRPQQKSIVKLIIPPRNAPKLIVSANVTKPTSTKESTS